MYKKFIKYVAFILTMVILVSCSPKEIVGKDSNGGDKLYTDINRFITSPDSSSSYQNLPKKFSFSTETLSNPFKMEVEKEDGNFEEGNFVFAAISRNFNNHFLLELGDTSFDFPVGSMISVDTKKISSIYWTENNEQEELAAFTITKAEELKDIKDTVESSEKYIEDSGEITFKSIEKAKDPFGDTLVLYFDFKNNEDKEVAPNMNSFQFYQGNVRLEPSIFSIEGNSDTSSLQFTANQGTYPKKTQKYFLALRPVNMNVEGAEDVKYNIDEPLEIKKYDDDFNLKFLYELNYKN